MKVWAGVWGRGYDQMCNPGTTELRTGSRWVVQRRFVVRGHCPVLGPRRRERVARPEMKTPYVPPWYPGNHPTLLLQGSL